jgi:flagellar basal-body rod protein FlgF
MDTGLNSGVAAMKSAEKRLETITSNLANVTTHGYKRQNAVVRTFSIGTGASKHPEIATQHTTDFTQGELEHTSNPLDLALDGDGFFAVDSPSGTAYTRNGQFRMDDQGVLLTQEGHPVQWSGSRPTLRPSAEPITVFESGEVHQGASVIGRLKIVSLSSLQDLSLKTDGEWVAPQGVRERPSDALVRQGSLERANVNSMDELVAMVVAQRNFESSSTLMRSIDQTYKRLNTPH